MTKKIQAQPIQDQTWILCEQGQRLGMLSLQDAEYRLLIKGGQHTFVSVQDLEQHLHARLHFEQKQVVTDKQAQFVDHLPIKHDEAHNVVKTPFISYTKLPQSDVRFAAGYWAIQFSTGWSGSWCPKVSTLEENTHVGPFSTKLEMNTILAQKNKDRDK